MNAKTQVRLSARFHHTNGEVTGYAGRHTTIGNIAGDLMGIQKRCGLNGDVSVIKLTITPEVEQTAAREPETPEPAESFPVYAPPDTSKFYPEGF